jgi:hypothetical protein
MKTGQCEAATVDLVAGATRCNETAGHDGPHDDGRMTWDDAPTNAGPCASCLNCKCGKRAPSSPTVDRKETGVIQGPESAVLSTFPVGSGSADESDHE